MSYAPPPAIRHALLVRQQVLTQLVDTIVHNSFQFTNTVTLAAAGEVDLLLGFFIDGLDDIEIAMNQEFALQGLPVEVGIAGIFTHQSPYVRFPKSGSVGTCELGDILFLITYEDIPSEPLALGNALLLQAKRNFSGIPITDIQRRLYEEFRSFRYVHNKTLAALGVRRLPPKSRSGLGYWELDYTATPAGAAHAPATKFIGAPQARSGKVGGATFGETFVRLMLGHAGRGFQLQPKGKGWTQIIFDLLENTVKRTATRKNLGIHGWPRGAGSLVTRALANPAAAGWPHAVRNSLSEILAHYGLGAEGKRIETPEMLIGYDELKGLLKEHNLNIESDALEDGDDTAEETENPEEPPPILPRRKSDSGNGDGTANVVLINLRNRKTISQQKPIIL